MIKNDTLKIAFFGKIIHIFHVISTLKAKREKRFLIQAYATCKRRKPQNKEIYTIFEKYICINITKITIKSIIWLTTKRKVLIIKLKEEKR